MTLCEVAHYFHVPPWELARQPVFWRDVGAMILWAKAKAAADMENS